MDWLMALAGRRADGSWFEDCSHKRYPIPVVALVDVESWKLRGQVGSLSLSLLCVCVWFWQCACICSCLLYISFPTSGFLFKFVVTTFVM